MNLSNYKGVAVAAGLVAAGALLWFERPNKAHVTATDAAELCAGVCDRTAELNGNATGAGALWYTREWSIDYSITNSWGGYTSFVVNVTAPSPSPNGIYLFWKRVKGSIALSPGNGSLVGDTIDVYTNRAKVSGVWRYLFDCGPAGASTQTKYPRSWVFAKNYNPFDSSVTSAVQFVADYYIPSGGDITTTNFYAWATDPFSDTLSQIPTVAGYHFTLTGVTNAPTRARSISPRTLKAYTNAIGITFDQSTIAAIRASLATNADYTLINRRSPTYSAYFIGPTNDAANYDGLAELPLVATSQWLTVYTNWISGSDSPTNTYTNAHLGKFVTTNELSWHYSALYRLRDSTCAVTGGEWTNRYIQGNATWATSDPVGGFAAAYADLQTKWAFNPEVYGCSSGVGGHLPTTYFTCWTGAGTPTRQYSVIMYVTAVKFTADDIYTNVPCRREFMVSVPDVTGSLYTSPGGGNPIPKKPAYWTDVNPTTNLWYRWSTNATSTMLSSTSSVYVGAIPSTYVLPPLSDLDTSTTDGDWRGWDSTSQLCVLRWSQRACTNATFDGRYTP
jgi:hypothetical protein